MRNPRYQVFHSRVLARDKYTCQYPGCTCNQNVEVHHIKRYSQYPHLRTAIHNGITLCKPHHMMVTGKEQHYENMFFKIVANKGKTDFSLYARSKKKNKKKNIYKKFNRNRRCNY